MKKRLKFQASVLLFLILFFCAARLSSCDPVFFWNRREHLLDIVIRMFPPDFGFLPSVLSPLAATVKMSVTGTFLGTALALLLAPVCAANLKRNRICRFTVRLLVQVLRSFPALILALMATFLFGLGTFAGTVAIALYTLAIMTRLTYEDIEKTSLSACHALQAMGCGSAVACYRAVFPEITPAYLTNALYLLETNVRHSSILGYVGAGGIGLLLNEKISWREYDKVSVILILLFLAVCLIEACTAFLIRIVQHKKQIPVYARRILCLFLAGLFLLCTVTINGPDFSHTSTEAVRNMFHGLLHPDWGFFFQADKAGLGYLLLETVCISLVGTCLGAALALPLSFCSTSRLLPKPIAALFRLLIIGIRSVPFMIYGLIFIRVTGPGAFAGVLTLSVCSVGLLCKRFTEAIEALDWGPYDALRNMGVRTLPCIRYAILPQLADVFLSMSLYRFDINIREASILGLVGAGGIGAPLIFSMNQYAWNETGAIALGLVILVWVIDQVSSQIKSQKL